MKLHGVPPIFLYKPNTFMKAGYAKGFTLVELVLVLLLSSILAVIAVIKYPGDGINLSAQADQLIGDIRYTQSLSMHRGQRYRINFAADRYWISSRDGATLYPHPASGATNILLNPGIALASTHGFLVFDGNGTPYTNSLLPGSALGADAVITLSAGADVRTVRISPQTGRVIKL